MQRILVVDDEIDVCDFVKNFFEERGFVVQTALNGQEALSMLKRERPQLVLLDIKMRTMDGLTLLRHIRDFDKELKVIMVTALEDQDKMEEAYKFGVVDYITKPLVLEHLEKTVLKALTA